MITITKALTFRASSIGDCLMGKYLLDNIHAQYPTARLGLVVGSKAGMIRGLLAAYPYIEVVEANRRSPASLWRLWRAWRGSDLVVTQYAGKAGGRFGFGSKLMGRLLGKKLIGFSDASRFNNFLYDTLVPFDPATAPAEMERQALRVAGLAVPLPYPTLAPPPSKGALQKFNLTPGLYIVAHLFSGGIKRALRPDKRRELVKELRSVLPKNVEILLTGIQTEREEAQAAAGSDARVIAGDTTLQEAIELAQNAVATLSLDTGVGHIAAQLGKPAVVLVSCLGAQWWGPAQYGPGAPVKLFSRPEPGGHRMVDYPPCLNEIDVAEVAAAALRQI